MDDRALIKLTMRGPVVATGNADAWAAYRQTFRQQHCVLLPQLLDPSVLAYALPRLANERNRLYVHEDYNRPQDRHLQGGHNMRARALMFGHEHPVNNLLYLLLQQRPFLQAVDDICGCDGNLRQVSGRYFELHPRAGHFQTWHQDCAHERILGIVINLSPRRYAGGQFQLRHAVTKQTVATVASELGDCHLFRIHRRLEHRTTLVEGTVPRCVYAGWVHGENAQRSREDGLPAATGDEP